MSEVPLVNHCLAPVRRVAPCTGSRTNRCALASINANGGTVYYNRNNPANAYLRGQTYDLSGAGTLTAAVPEPRTIVLVLLFAVPVFAGLRRASQDRAHSRP